MTKEEKLELCTQVLCAMMQSTTYKPNLKTALMVRDDKNGRFKKVAEGKFEPIPELFPDTAHTSDTTIIKGKKPLPKERYDFEEIGMIFARDAVRMVDNMMEVIGVGSHHYADEFEANRDFINTSDQK